MADGIIQLVVYFAPLVQVGCLVYLVVLVRRYIRDARRAFKRPFR